MHATSSVSRRPGDWDCTCGELNFASRLQCRKCHADRRGGGAAPGGAPSAPVRALSGGPTAQAVEVPVPDQDNQQTPVRPGDWYCPSCGDLNFASRTQCRKCSTQKPRTGLNFQYGDWHCPMCQELNFGRRTMCRRCNTPRDAPRAKPGDWFCANCGDLNFASREECRKCSAPVRAERVPAKGKPGDWTCPTCKELNFASRTECRHCHTELKPDTARVGLKTGDWFCTQCHDLNFASRDICRKCSAAKPLLE